MRLQQEKLKLEFRKLSIRLTFSKLPQFFGCKDAGRGDDVVADHPVVRVVWETWHGNNYHDDEDEDGHDDDDDDKERDDGR